MLGIYPTRGAILLVALGAPAGLLLGLFSPGLWLAGVAWIALSLALIAADAWLGADRHKLKLDVTIPPIIGLGSKAEVVVRATFARSFPHRAELALEAGDRLVLQPDRMLMPLSGPEGRAVFDLTARRRGQDKIVRLFVRWPGPLRLVWKQRVEPLDRPVLVTPNIRAVQDEAIRLFARDALFGLKSQIQLGEGSEYHALKEFMPGHDIGAIDWKQTARHAKLLVKEFRTERNHHVVFALDTGRLMCEPLGPSRGEDPEEKARPSKLGAPPNRKTANTFAGGAPDGLPKIDRALNAALLLAYVGLKMGDRVALYGFDARPNLISGAVAGAGAFPLLQRLAASLDYSNEETNYTLGLTTLAGQLERRSLVVVFTDFADATSAELMVENITRLVRRHLVLFVAFRDEELEAMVRAEPVTADDVSRAVIADRLLRERTVVIERLRRLGVEILETAADRLGPELVSRYLEMKRRDLL